MRTRVYVDGFNLFYATLSRTEYKWLDLYALFQYRLLDASAVVEQVNYYTAPIKAASSDDPEAPLRQQRYLRALQTFRPGKVVVQQGFIQKTTPALRLAEDLGGLAKGTPVRVTQLSEKQTDVNLAADLISDAWRGLVEQVVICSNDSDLHGALRVLRRDLPALRIGLVAPVLEERQVSADLKRMVDWYKVIRPSHVADAQLPDKIPGTPLTRPDAWRDRREIAT